MFTLSEYIKQKSRIRYLALVLVLVLAECVVFGIAQYYKTKTNLQEQVQASALSITTALEEKNINFAIQQVKYISDISMLHNVRLLIDNSEIVGPIGVGPKFNLNVCSISALRNIQLQACKSLTDKGTSTWFISFILMQFLALTVAFRYLLNESQSLLRLVSKELSLEESLHSQGSIVEINQIKSKLIELTNKLSAQLKNEYKLEITERVAHDIRSPVAALESIIGNLQGVDENLRKIVSFAVERINKIANDLLSEFRHESAKTITIEIKVSNLVDKLIDEKKLINPTKAIVFNTNYTIHIFEPAQALNEQELMRILSNLLNNSIESIAESGEITISIVSVGMELRISVQDNGSGISKADLERLGTKGYSVGKIGGSGFGLYYAKKSLQEWGGDLRVESVLGKGTEVTLYIPATSFG